MDACKLRQTGEKSERVVSSQPASQPAALVNVNESSAAALNFGVVVVKKKV